MALKSGLVEECSVALTSNSFFFWNSKPSQLRETDKTLSSTSFFSWILFFPLPLRGKKKKKKENSWQHIKDTKQRKM